MLVLVSTIPLAVVGALLVYTARVAVNDQVDTRRTPGVRTSATLRSREAWLAGHRAIERTLSTTGYTLTGASLLAALVGTLWRPWAAVAVALVCLLPLPVVLLRSAWVAHRVAAASTPR